MSQDVEPRTPRHLVPQTTRDRDGARLVRMAELPVAATCPRMDPTVAFDQPYCVAHCRQDPLRPAVQDSCSAAPRSASHHVRQRASEFDLGGPNVGSGLRFSAAAAHLRRLDPHRQDRHRATWRSPRERPPAPRRGVSLGRKHPEAREPLSPTTRRIARLRHDVPRWPRQTSWFNHLASLGGAATQRVLVDAANTTSFTCP